MHYHLEIIMPPTDDIEGAITEIMRPFDENLDHTDEDAYPKSAFWDYWGIGGRWSGSKLEATLGADKIEAFRKLLHDRKITVSGLQFGKPTLQPADQIVEVNRLWNETFPSSPVKECPLFNDYDDTYGDVMPLLDCPKALKCSHVIIAGLGYGDKRLQAKYMARDSIWNGVTHQKTTWDQTLEGALADHAEQLGNYKAEYADKYRPKDDWLVVTVDYHS